MKAHDAQRNRERNDFFQRRQERKPEPVKKETKHEKGEHNPTRSPCFDCEHVGMHRPGYPFCAKNVSNFPAVRECISKEPRH